MTRPDRQDPQTLLEQLRQSYKTDEAWSAFPEEKAAPREKLPDGYVRLSPVQPYLEGPGWRRKQILTIVLVCVIVAALVAAVILIRKFGIQLPFFKKK